MKKILFTIIYIVCFSTIFTSCNSDDTGNVSSITNYATFDYEPTLVLPLGDVYDASSVTATENGVSLPVIISGDTDVNTNSVGVYNVSFSATNSDGYSATVIQKVIVHDPAIIGTDVSGNIRDKNNNARKGVITLVEGTTSIFYCTDFGFSGAFPMYFQMNGDTISEISQVYINGVTNVVLTYNSGTLEFTTLIQPQGFSYTFEYY